MAAARSASLNPDPRMLLARKLLARQGESEPLDTTLLDLVHAVAEVTEDDREVVAAVVQMLRSGRVRLIGNFRGTIPDAA